MGQTRGVQKMTSTDHIVVRLKKGGFTKSMPAEQAFVSLADSLPFDKVYFVQPTDDGGYTLREAGTLIVDIVPLVGAPTIEVPQDERSQAQVSPPHSTPTPEATNPATAILEPLPVTKVEDVVFENDFKFTRPKSQSELLKAAGVVEPQKDMRTKAVRKLPAASIEVDGEDRPAPKRKTKSIKKPRIVKSSEPDLTGDDWDRGLPPPVRVGPSKTKVTGFRIATHAEAAAASHFNDTAFKGN